MGRLAAWVVAVWLAAGPALADTVLVFAAQSMAEAIAAAGARFSEETGTEVVVSLGASSTMARQIEAGAPAHLFISANRQWIDYLEERQAVRPETRADIAGNALVLIAGPDAPEAALGEGLSGLPEALGDGRLALGDPAHVPAGQYAEQALRALGLWDRLEGRLAPTSNVRDALRFVEQGAAPFGIVYATDAAASDRVRIAGAFPEYSHAPIAYPAALTMVQGPPAAAELLAFLQGPEAVGIFLGLGFALIPNTGS